jgi:hypothetical protein
MGVGRDRRVRRLVVENKNRNREKREMTRKDLVIDQALRPTGIHQYSQPAPSFMFSVI